MLANIDFWAAVAVIIQLCLLFVQIVARLRKNYELAITLGFVAAAFFLFWSLMLTLALH